MSLISFEGALQQVLEEGYRVSIQQERDGSTAIHIDRVVTVDTATHQPVIIKEPTFSEAIEMFRTWA